MSGLSWNFNNGIANLDSGDLSARVDPANPWRGLHQISMAGNPMPGMSLLGVESDSDLDRTPPSDLYVRGTDLIACYESVSQRPLHPHLYWRELGQPNPPGVMAGLELVVSVQTHLLDSDPKLSICSRMEANEVYELASTDPVHFNSVATESHDNNTDSESKGLVLTRLEDGKTSYLQMVHPSDWQQANPPPVSEAGKGVLLRSNLFLERLEKGVIRRARLRGLFLNRHNDLQTAVACYHEFANSVPPLTV